MSIRRQAFVKGCAVLLLLLAASPLTAPFSAGHPLDLFGDSAFHLQGKQPPGDPNVTLPTTPVVSLAFFPARRQSTQTGDPRTRGLASLDVPLRL